MTSHKKLDRCATPVFLLLNKVDLLNEAALAQRLQYWSTHTQVDQIIPIAALHAYNTAQVLTHILACLPEHAPYYPKDMLTDKPERFFATEIIREQIMRHYYQEIPYSVAVTIQTFKETENLVHIHALIYVARKSQKGILIGSQGSALKKVGTAARKALEEFLGKKVFLTQHVKVMPDWKSNPQCLQQLGYC